MKQGGAPHAALRTGREQPLVCSNQPTSLRFCRQSKPAIRRYVCGNNHNTSPSERFELPKVGDASDGKVPAVNNFFFEGTAAPAGCFFSRQSCLKPFPGACRRCRQLRQEWLRCRRLGRCPRRFPGRKSRASILSQSVPPDAKKNSRTPPGTLARVMRQGSARCTKSLQYRERQGVFFGGSFCGAPCF